MGFGLFLREGKGGRGKQGGKERFLGEGVRGRMEQASDGGLDSTSLARLKGRVGTLDQQCRAFLRANARQLVLAEEALRGLALAAPGGDSEVRAELANTVLGLLGVYRDSFPNETTRNSNVR